MDLPSGGDFLERLGAAIKLERERVGMSRQELADLAGTTYNTINSIELGRNTYIKTLWRICQALDVYPSQLCEDAERLAGKKTSQ